MPMLETDHDYSKETFNQKFCSRCGARCCKVGVYVPLTIPEIFRMNKLATKFKVNVKLSLEPLKGELTWVMSYASKPCGFLDLKTNRCIIYEARPELCREFYCEPKVIFGRE
jgi:Fe-S-cluster containining protein